VPGEPVEFKPLMAGAPDTPGEPIAPDFTANACSRRAARAGPRCAARATGTTARAAASTRRKARTRRSEHKGRRHQSDSKFVCHPATPSSNCCAV
jgi:hypothetical protein